LVHGIARNFPFRSCGPDHWPYHLIVRRFPAFTLLAAATDPIAAELFSLALVDEALPEDTQVIGPWEDDFVQRAAEIELGARLPSDIRVEVHGISACCD
jgi:hypothetical protein